MEVKKRKLVNHFIKKIDLMKFTNLSKRSPIHVSTADVEMRSINDPKLGVKNSAAQ